MSATVHPAWNRDALPHGSATSSMLDVLTLHSSRRLWRAGYAAALLLHVSAGVFLLFHHSEAPPSKENEMELVLSPPEAAAPPAPPQEPLPATPDVPAPPEDTPPPELPQDIAPAEEAKPPPPPPKPKPKQQAPKIKKAAPPAPPRAATLPRQAETAAPSATAPAGAAAGRADAGASAAPAGLPTDYVGSIYKRINHEAASRYPEASREREEEGRVGYTLILDAHGGLVSLQIQSSGIQALDRAAQEALHAAAPFPQPPALGASRYKLSGAIVFRLE